MPDAFGPEAVRTVQLFAGLMLELPVGAGAGDSTQVDEGLKMQ